MSFYKKLESKIMKDTKDYGVNLVDVIITKKTIVMVAQNQKDADKVNKVWDKLEKRDGYSIGCIVDYK